MNWWVKSSKRFAHLLNCLECILILGSTINGCISISAFSSLFGTPVGTTGFAIGLKMCAIAAKIKKCKSIISKKKKQHNKMALFAKSKNSIEVLILKALMNLDISHDEFGSINNVLKEYDRMKEEIKHLKTWSSLAY